MIERRKNLALQERLDVQEIALVRLGRKLVTEGRLHEQAFIALKLGLGCLERARNNPGLREVGAGLMVTLTNSSPQREEETASDKP